jgi:hypothetical protein
MPFLIPSMLRPLTPNTTGLVKSQIQKSQTERQLEMIVPYREVAGRKQRHGENSERNSIDCWPAEVWYAFWPKVIEVTEQDTEEECINPRVGEIHDLPSDELVGRH